MQRHTRDAPASTAAPSTSANGCNCGRCKRPSKSLRRGLCQRCYMAAWRGAETAAACEACNHADPRALVRRRFVDDAGALLWHTVCANCSTIAGRRAVTLAALEAEVLPAACDRRRAGERRGGDRRGAGGDRRAQLARVGVGDRRASPGRRASDRAA